MALSSINPVEEKQKKTALEKFATGLDIAQGVGNLAVTGASLANMAGGSGKMSGMQAYLKKKQGNFDIGTVG